MKRQVALGAALSIVFLFLAFRNVDWERTGTALLSADPAWVFLSIVLTMVGHYTRAYRWKFMMLPVRDIPTCQLFSATTIGLMANNLLPARLGEVVRAFVLSREAQVSRASTLAAIVYERVVDVFVLLGLLWITMLNVTGPEWLRDSGYVLLALNLLVLAVILVVVRFPTATGGLLAYLTTRMSPERSERLQVMVAAFIDGLASAGRPALLLPVALTSILVWGFALVGTWCGMLSMDLQLPFSAVITLVVFVSIGTMIPSAPAYVGTMQFACIASLAIYSVGKSEALAFSFLFHFTQFAPTTALGLFYVWKSDFGLRDLSVQGRGSDFPGN